MKKNANNRKSIELIIHISILSRIPRLELEIQHSHNRKRKKKIFNAILDSIAIITESENFTILNDCGPNFFHLEEYNSDRKKIIH